MVLLLWLACEPTVPDFVSEDPDETGAPDSEPLADDSGDSAPPDCWQGELVDEGFGSSLLARESGVAVGAPWGESGRVYQGCELLLEGERSLGLSLAELDGELIAGAPLAGEGTGQAGELQPQEGELLGLGLYADQDGLLATTATGLRDGAGLTELGPRPGPVMRVEDRRVVGMPRGDSALWVEEERLDRVEDYDEAGYAICSADLDQDGLTDLAVGAPGADRVYLLLGDWTSLPLAEREQLRGEGRFGHSLACAPGLLLVGAPVAGDGSAGRVHRFEGGPADWEEGEILVEGDAGDLAGWALAWDEDTVYVGAPGLADRPGRVIRASR